MEVTFDQVLVIASLIVGTGIFGGILKGVLVLAGMRSDLGHVLEHLEDHEARLRAMEGK